ncbi:MAG: lysophospholipid acyltransferase family protein [Phycisphaerae bacterium]
MRIWYTFCRDWCRFYVNVFHWGRAYNRHFVPPSGSVLLVSNHQSFLDPVVVGYCLNREVDYMARDTLFKNPVFGKIIRSVNAFPVKRGEADLTAIKETLRRLRDQRVMLLFPEGTRTPDGLIREFKPGFALLARKANAPIIPVVVDGAFEAWPRSSPVPHPFIPINVIYGKPILPEEVKSRTPEEFVKMIHQIMIKMQNGLRLKAGKTPYNYEKLTANSLQQTASESGGDSTNENLTG